MEDYLSGSGILDGENSTTTTTTCEALTSSNSLNVSDPSLHVDVVVRAVNVVMADVILLLGNFLNVLTLILILKYNKLHSLSFAIAAQIAICNIIKASVFSLPTVINNVMGQWVLGEHICVACAFARHFSSTVRGGLFLIFSLDRFGVVFFPFTYPRYSQRIVVVACVSSWIISLLFSLTHIPPLLNCFGLVEVINDCFTIPTCSRNCRIIVTLWVYLVYFQFPFIAAGCFIALYVKGRKIRKAESKMLGKSKKTMSDSDWRALKTISILFGSFLLVTVLPLTLALIFEQFVGIFVYILLSLLGILINMVVVTDPIVILRNADAKSSYMKLCSEVKEALTNCCKGKWGTYIGTWTDHYMFLICSVTSLTCTLYTQVSHFHIYQSLIYHTYGSVLISLATLNLSKKKRNLSQMENMYGSSLTARKVFWQIKQNKQNFQSPLHTRITAHRKITCILQLFKKPTIVTNNSNVLSKHITDKGSTKPKCLNC